MVWEDSTVVGMTTEYYNSIPLKKGRYKTRDFFNETLYEFARVSTHLFDNIGDHIFSYKEKQLSAIFLPAFYNLGFGAMQEHPTKRSKKNKISTAWLDYWVQKDDCVYLIEVKHAWQYFDGILQKDSIEKINKSINQLKEIKEGSLDELSYLENTFKVSLLVLPLYRNISNKTELNADAEYKTSAEEMNEVLENINADLPDTVSWVGAWLLPKRMQYTFEDNDVFMLRSIPGVVFVATIV